MYKGIQILESNISSNSHMLNSYLLDTEPEDSNWLPGGR